MVRNRLEIREQRTRDRRLNRLQPNRKWFNLLSLDFSSILQDNDLSHVPPRTKSVRGCMKILIDVATFEVDTT